jgi:hypothetical protein
MLAFERTIGEVGRALILGMLIGYWEFWKRIVGRGTAR